MAANIISMSILKQILRLRSQGKGIKEIVRQTGTAKNTVKKYLRLAESSRIPFDVLLLETDSALQHQLARTQPAASSEYTYLEGMKAYLLQELRNPHVSRWLLWGEYRQQRPLGYGYTQFCYYIQTWLRPQAATMHFEYQPGEKLFVDFTGDKLTTIDPDTGQVIHCEVFVAILGYSQYTYLEAVPSQKLEDVLRVCENALLYFGGSPQVIIPDNLKAAVVKADRYEPVLNEAFADFANHYQMAVMPARPYRPRDKAPVENAVKIAYRRIFAPLRHQRFFSLAALNQAIRAQLAVHHQTPLRNQPKESRLQRFEQQEKPRLRALPAEAYYLKRYAKVKVMKNGHVRLGIDHHYYSVPYRYIGQLVTLCFTQRDLTIWYQSQSIAYHARVFTPHQYTTLKEHLAPPHQYRSAWSTEFFLSQARQIHPVLETYLAGVITAKPHPEMAYKSCQGILKLARKAMYTNELVPACQQAMSLKVYTYSFLKRILERGMMKVTEPINENFSTPLHENIRGASLYQ